MILTTGYEICLDYLWDRLVSAGIARGERGEGEWDRRTSDISLGILNSLNRIVWMNDLNRLSLSSVGVIGEVDVGAIG